MFFHYTAAHIVNILCHILAGTLAMLAGLVALFASKGGALHRRAGRLFVYAYSLVILTAVVGVLVFRFRSFLAVATIASSYSLFSGFRATRLRGRRPAALDQIAAMVALAAPALFLAAIHVLNTPWAPVLTWTVLGSLLAMSSYDLLRSALPTLWLRRTWVHEHIVKIVGAFDALTATLAATAMPQHQPWSAVVPNLLGTAVILGFFLAGPQAWNGKRRDGPADKLKAASHTVSTPAHPTPLPPHPKS